MAASSQLPDNSQPPSLGNASTNSSLYPKQLSVPLPLSPHTTLHIQITCLETSILAFLTTTDPSNTAGLSHLGSFVCAMPNVSFISMLRQDLVLLQHSDTEQRFQPSDPLSTTLYTVPSSIDFTTRVAKIIAQRTGKPTYIGCSVIFGSTTVEEEIAGIKVAIDGIMGIIQKNL